MPKYANAGRKCIWFFIYLTTLFFISGCTRRVELPQDDASKEQRRQKEVEMMHREMKNQ